MTPVLAVSDGVVAAVHNTPPDDCCWLMVKHNDGWQSLYVHLNNDHHLTDDGSGYGVRTDLSAGDRVEAGQVIGWVGDSGNAEETLPHLHFELRHKGGYAVDAYASLRAAHSRADLPPFFGVYRDDDEFPVPSAEALVTAGGFWPCDDIGLEFCPSRLTSSADIGDLLGRLFDLEFPVVPEQQQTIALQQLFSGRTLDQVVGCRPIETCLQTGITAGEVVRLVDWAYRVKALTELPEIPLSAVPLLGPDQAEANLRFLGAIEICDPDLDATRLLTRADVVQLITPWVLDSPSTSCRQPSSTDI
jgi:murein DD-endopeptidase MepM/ murein hydrolase activator NlpD